MLHKPWETLKTDSEMAAAKGALAAIGQVHWDRGALAAPQFGGGDRQVYASQASFEKRRPRFRFSGTKGMAGSRH
jgi:hypothetical protein